MGSKWWGRRNSKKQGKNASSERDFPKAAPDVFERLFDYENKIVRLSGGGIFRAQADSVFRWHSVSEEEYAVLGDRVRALYERRDGSFVLVDWACAVRDKRTGLYFADSPPRACPCDERFALRFFLDHQDCGSTPRMDSLVERWQADEELFFHPENARPARPVSHWRGKGYSTVLLHEHAEPQSAPYAIGGLLYSMERGIDLVRSFCGVHLVRGAELPFARFFWRYSVEPTQGSIEGLVGGPESVAPEDLDAELAETEIPELVRRVRDLADGPINLLAAEDRADKSEDPPNKPELLSAFAELNSHLPQFVRMAARLKAATDEWSEARKQKAEETALAAVESVSGETLVLKTGDLPAGSDVERDLLPSVDTQMGKEPLNLFRKEGDGWWIQYGGGKGFHLRSYVGCIYIRELLSRPGEPVPALELAALVSQGPEIPETDAGEAVDVKALRAYRERKASLVEERDRAREEQRFLDADLAETEIEQLEDAISGATGIGGEIRKLGAEHERARKRILSAANTVIEKIALCDPALGSHLQSSLDFGGTPCYLPQTSTAWET